MQQITISHDAELLYQGNIAQITFLGVAIECNFDIIGHLKTQAGKFKRLNFVLQASSGASKQITIKGQLCVQTVRKVKQNQFLVCLRFLQPSPQMLAQIKSLTTSVSAANVVTSLPISPKEEEMPDITDNVAMLR